MSNPAADILRNFDALCAEFERDMELAIKGLKQLQAENDRLRADIEMFKAQIEQMEFDAMERDELDTMP